MAKDKIIFSDNDNYVKFKSFTGKLYSSEVIVT